MHDHHDNSQHSPEAGAAQGCNKTMMRLENGDTIPEGCYGRTRDGRKVGPMRRSILSHSRYPWSCDGAARCWNDAGERFHGACAPQSDIIAAWGEDPATGTPKIWRDMTPEEKGALLLAAHEGKVIEACCPGSAREDWMACDPRWRNSWAYRVRPEPKREVVDMFYFQGSDPKKIGTIDLIDGKVDPKSIKIEPVK